MKFLSWRWNLTRDEKRDVAGAFLTLSGFMVGHAILETARDSLFLAKLPSTELPWVYLSIAFISLLLTRFHRRLASLFPARNEISLWLSISGAITLVFWMLVGHAGAWIFYALYVWSGVLVTLIGVRFWTLLGGIFSLTQAKRLFALIGTGSVSGAIVGSFIAVILAANFGPRQLLLAAAVALLVASVAPRVMGFRAGSSEPRMDEAGEEFHAVLRKVWAGPYLRRVGLLILLSTVTFTLVDYLFKSAADRYVPAIQLDEFFSGIYLALNLASLMVQLFLAPRLLRWFGVHSNQGVTPGLMLLACLGFWVGGGLAAALFLKAVDGSLRHSLHRTATELLFVPLPERIRNQAKGVIDVLGQRGGQALASLAILMTLQFGGTEGVFLVLTLVAAAVWLLSVPGVKQHYLNVFREILTSEITQTRIDFPALDTASVEKLQQTLNQPDDRKVMAALEILEQQDKQEAVPALILYHPSPEVVLRALELLGDSARGDILPVLQRLLSHEQESIRAAALRSLSRRGGPEARSALRRALKDPSAAVRATALIQVVASGEEPSARLEELRSLCTQDPISCPRAVAQAIRERPSLHFSSLLIWLAQRTSSDGETQLEVVRAMQAVGSLDFFDVLVSFLGIRRLREDATSALLALRPSPLVRLEAYLTNTRAPQRIRCHIPAAIIRLDPFSGAALLLDHLESENDGMVRYKILRALGAIRAEDPQVEMSDEALQSALDRTIGSSLAYAEWRQQLAASVFAHPRADNAIHAVLVKLLHHKQTHTMERAFRLLNLIYVNEDFRKIYDGLQSREENSRASSRELLEHLVPKTMSATLLELMDDSVRVPKTRPGESADYASILEALFQSSSEIIHCLAVRQIACLEPPGWQAFLRRRNRGATPAVAETIAAVLRDEEPAVGGLGAG